MLLACGYRQGDEGIIWLVIESGYHGRLKEDASLLVKVLWRQSNSINKNFMTRSWWWSWNRLIRLAEMFVNKLKLKRVTAIGDNKQTLRNSFHVSAWNGFSLTINNCRPVPLRRHYRYETIRNRSCFATKHTRSHRNIIWNFQLKNRRGRWSARFAGKTIFTSRENIIWGSGQKSPFRKN